MRTAKILGFILPAVLAVVAFAVIPGLRGQPQNPPAKSQRKAVDESRFPIADFSAAEPTDPIQRARRRSRQQKYDKSDWAVNPDAVSDSTVRVDSVDQNLPAFPLAQSAVVVTGKITDSRAYLSNDKTGIYSVFSVQVDEVIKNASGKTLVPGASLELEREGGRVKFPSGRIHLYITNEQDMPLVGSRYVLFLADGNNDLAFQIVTGYELREGKVYPLDDLPKPKVYQNADQTTFFGELRMKIPNP